MKIQVKKQYGGNVILKANKKRRSLLEKNKQNKFCAEFKEKNFFEANEEEIGEAFRRFQKRKNRTSRNANFCRLCL